MYFFNVVKITEMKICNYLRLIKTVAIFGYLAKLIHLHPQHFIHHSLANVYIYYYLN